MDCNLSGSSFHGDSPDKNTGVGCHTLLQGYFPNPGIEPRSPTFQVDCLPAEPPGKPNSMLSIINVIILNYYCVTQNIGNVLICICVVVCACMYMCMYSSSEGKAPAMQETRVQSLHWEDLLERGKATHTSVLA